MKRLLFDLETDGLLDTVSKIHCGVVLDIDTGELSEYGPGEIPALLGHLSTADILCGQNICGYDMIVLERLYGYDVLRHKYLDTRAISQTIYPGSGKKGQLLQHDFITRQRPGGDFMPGNLLGRHSLEAWSHRLQLGEDGKIKYAGGWDKWTPEMQRYCVGDVRATARLLTHLLKREWPHEVFYLEAMMLYYVERQRQFGVGFNTDAAIALLGDLAGKQGALTRQLCEIFPPVTVPDGPPVTWKRNAVCRKYIEGEEGYFPPRVKGESFQKYKVEEFNPASARHIARRLIEKYSWEPNDYTPGGQPQVTDDIMRDLPWPEAQLYADYQGLKKVLGYISEGAQAWLKLERNGRIHGSVYPLGATTHRASHAHPNLAQIPRVDSPYGKECRALFVAGGGSVPRDYVLVGADAASLQLAIYAHYVANFDDGVLAKIVGDPDGDAHEYMRKASGLFTRARQKTLTYATWFGAGLYKQGLIVLQDWREAHDAGLTAEPVPPLRAARRLGAKVNARLRTKMRGYSKVQNSCAVAAKRGFVKCLDGRRINVSSDHLALSALLQGNEAVVMKRAYDFAWRALAEHVRKGDAFPALWIHDEFQWACHPEVAEYVGKTLAKSIADAGASLNMRLPLRGAYKVGKTWSETH